MSRHGLEHFNFEIDWSTNFVWNTRKTGKNLRFNRPRLNSLFNQCCILNIIKNRRFKYQNSYNIIYQYISNTMSLIKRLSKYFSECKWLQNKVLVNLKNLLTFKYFNNMLSFIAYAFMLRCIFFDDVWSWAKIDKSRNPNWQVVLVKDDIMTYMMINTPYMEA